ncbi:MAG: LysM peptidoglycan-binding domain-containing protein [Deltaproteobacteria bacterium]|nr:LysM peptidoglycan-binding domain-containing protein [Deltaproteobacteria bacterium]
MNPRRTVLALLLLCLAPAARATDAAVPEAVAAAAVAAVPPSAPTIGPLPTPASKATATPTSTSTPPALSEGPPQRARVEGATEKPGAPAGEPAADADDGDDEEIEAAVEAQSQELEELRAAEEQTRPLDATTADERAARAAAALGLESPLRHRLEEALSREPGAAEQVAGRIPGLPEIDHDLRRLQAEYDIPIDVNDSVVAYVRFFQHPKVRKHFVKWLGRAPRYIPRFREILREEGLPEDTVFLAMIESGFANLAQSRARAVGPWQFIAGTGKRMGLRQDFWVDERRDPEKAAHAAARYLKELHDQFGDWRLAWAGYNAGGGKISRAQRKGHQDFWEMAKARRVLKRETQGYVPKLMAAAIVVKHAEAFGFAREELETESWIPYELVTVPRATLLSHLAEAAEVPEKTLLELNPELRRTCTPPRSHALKVPRGQGEAFARNWERVAEQAGQLAFAHHRLQKGDTLASVAQAYGVPVATVQRMNGLKPGRRVRPGTELVVPLSKQARREAVAAVAAEPEPAERPARRPAVARTPVAGGMVPRALGMEAAAGNRETVRVGAGDSLWAIAQRFGVALDELCRWNGIRNPRRHRLFPGDELVVYSRASGPAARPPG